MIYRTLKNKKYIPLNYISFEGSEGNLTFPISLFIFSPFHLVVIILEFHGICLEGNLQRMSQDVLPSPLLPI